MSDSATLGGHGERCFQKTSNKKFAKNPGSRLERRSIPRSAPRSPSATTAATIAFALPSSRRSDATAWCSCYFPPLDRLPLSPLAVHVRRALRSALLDATDHAAHVDADGGVPRLELALAIVLVDDIRGESSRHYRCICGELVVLLCGGGCGELIVLCGGRGGDYDDGDAHSGWSARQRVLVRAPTRG